MKKTILSNEALSDFCMEFSLLIRAGVGTADALCLLAEESDSEDAALLAGIAARAEDGEQLSAVLEGAKIFPAYLIEMVRVGEQSGRLEEVFEGLANHYKAQGRLGRQIRNALLYPSILTLLMLIVLVVLLAKVLPVFDQVFAQMGTGLTGLGGGLLQLGMALDACMPALCVVLALAVLTVTAFTASAPLRVSFLSWWNRRHGDKGLSRKIATARFASALSMGLRSGLSMEAALETAAPFAGDTAAAAGRVENCRNRLFAGAALAEALQESGLLPAGSCRLLALGFRSGSGDTVMAEIARRLEEEAEESIEEKVGRVEPALVIVTSFMIGAILLSVMLPLIHIMSAL